MALYGADVESLRQLAQTFNNKSQVLDNDVNLALKALVSATDWQGSDGDKFKDDWDSVLAPQLRNAAQALAQASWDLNRNADEQEQASGGGAGGGGAGGVVGSSYGGGGVTGSSGSFGGGGGSGSAGVTGSTGSFEDAGISGSSGSFGGGGGSGSAGVTGSSGSFAASGIAVGGKFGQQGVHVFGDGASPINYLPELPQLSTQYPTDFVEIPERSVES